MLKFLNTTAAVLGLLTAAVAPPALAQLAYSPPQPFARQPDLSIPIHTNAGNCPDAIAFWEELRPYEGGVEIGTVLDTAAVAVGPARFMDSQDKVVIYAAPLSPEYASCSGWVDSYSDSYTENLQYNVWFQWSHIYFRFDLNSIEVRPTEIEYQSVWAGRPYVRWAIAD